MLGDLEAQRQSGGDGVHSSGADLGSAALLIILGALNARRAIACSHHINGEAVASHLWDYKCGGRDPFVLITGLKPAAQRAPSTVPTRSLESRFGQASWSFMPLHVLAAAATFAWMLSSLRSSGQLLLRQKSPVATAIACCRLCELYIAAWCLCWFAPPSPFAGRDDCIDQDSACPQWAKAVDGTSECERNRVFMSQTCPRACKLCVQAADRLFSWHAVTNAVGPRACTLLVAGTLLVVAAARLIVANLTVATQRRLALLLRVAARPLHLGGGLVMRTPIGPLLLALLRSLRAILAQLRHVLRLAAWAGCACVHCGRRRLILALGGSIEREFEAPFRR